VRVTFILRDKASHLQLPQHCPALYKLSRSSAVLAIAVVSTALSHALYSSERLPASNSALFAAPTIRHVGWPPAEAASLKAIALARQEPLMPILQRCGERLIPKGIGKYLHRSTVILLIFR
jgi:hypothetical protein